MNDGGSLEGKHVRQSNAWERYPKTSSRRLNRSGRVRKFGIRLPPNNGLERSTGTRNGQESLAEHTPRRPRHQRDDARRRVLARKNAVACALGQGVRTRHKQQQAKMRPSAAQPTPPTAPLAMADPTSQLRTRAASKRFARSQPAQAPEPNAEPTAAPSNQQPGA